MASVWQIAYARPMLGLPLHPLVVHAVVVLLPLGALALVAAVVSPPVRQRYGVLALLVATAGTASSVAAYFSGHALAETEPLPERHAALGAALMPAALAMAALGWLWWALEARRRDAAPGSAPVAPRVAGGLAVAAALAVTVLTVLTGHAGAVATWGSEAGGVPTGSTGVGGGVPTGPTGVTPPTYTLADVAEHADESSCWAAIDGGVYDLTGWVARHPGGPDRILALCGTDATARFTAQHGTSQRPAGELARFRIGDLGP